MSNNNKTSQKNKTKSSAPKPGFKGPNKAYLDAEYLCARFKKGSIEDVLSVGIVFTDENDMELDRYYSEVKLTPGHRLTPLISDLTGLTEAMLLVAPTYEEVMTEIVDMVKQYQVGHVLVWGGDKSSFQRDLDARRIERGLRADIIKFIETFENIQKEVSLRITGGLDQGLSLADMKTICGLGGYVAHNALSDAEDMLNCIRIVNEGSEKYSGVEAASYKHFRSDYIKNRSFTEEDDEIYKIQSEFGVPFLEELQKKGFADHPKTKAFMDDLEYLLGISDVHMGTFAEMVENKDK